MAEAPEINVDATTGFGCKSPRCIACTANSHPPPPVRLMTAWILQHRNMQVQATFSAGSVRKRGETCLKGDSRGPEGR